MSSRCVIDVIGQLDNLEMVLAACYGGVEFVVIRGCLIKLKVGVKMVSWG